MDRLPELREGSHNPALVIPRLARNPSRPGDPRPFSHLEDTMDRDEHREQVRLYFADRRPTVMPDRRALDSALYAMGELGLFHDDVESVSIEVALQIHAIVEVVKAHGFPDEMGM